MASGASTPQHHYPHQLPPASPGFAFPPFSPGHFTFYPEAGYQAGPGLLQPAGGYWLMQPSYVPQDPCAAALAASFEQASLNSARSPAHSASSLHPGALQGQVMGRGPGDQNRRRNTDARQRRYAEATRRTVYICDIDPQITEAQLASVFSACGNIVDCRVCGDPHTAMRFAFIEFEDDVAVRKALALSGRPIGNFSLRVRPSKTAIVPVNNGYLPRTEEEHALCARTVYAANIDKRLDKSKVRQIFENLCGPVSRLRLLGDSHHATRIAFVEFCKAESAEIALKCSGALLGSLPVRLAPSKTPVRPDPRDPDG